jgi:hypothetical protein
VSQLLIQQYLNQLATLKKVSGSQRESVIREAFKDLLKGWAKSHDLDLVPKYGTETKPAALHQRRRTRSSVYFLALPRALLTGYFFAFSTSFFAQAATMSTPSI